MCFFRGPDYDGLEQELSDISDAKRMKQKELECVTDKKSSSIMQVKLDGLHAVFLPSASAVRSSTADFFFSLLGDWVH